MNDNGCGGHHCIIIIIARVYLIQVMNAAQRQVAANLWTKPISLSNRSAKISAVNDDDSDAC